MDDFMVIVYKKHHYYIYSDTKGFIVHNTKKPFQEGHTHIKNFNTAKYLVTMSSSSKIPYHASNYIYTSLIRISTDKNYIKKLKEKLYKK